MPLSKKDMRILLRTALAGKPVCLVEFRLVEMEARKERLVAFVLGDVVKMDFDAIFDNFISSLTYSMNLKTRTANIADVNTKQEEYKQYGLQESLFAYALKDMVERGCSVVGLRWNGTKAAYNLYSKFGFKVIDKSIKAMSSELSKYTVKKMYVRTEKEREEAIRKANKAEPPERKAILTGDFDPFHSGHAYAVEQGLELADKLLIYVSDRRGKAADVKTRKGLIRKYIRDKGLGGRVRVYDGNKKSMQLTNEGYSIKICGSDLFSRMEGIMPYHGERIMAAKELIILTRPAHEHPADIWKVKDHFEKLGKIVHIIPPRKDVAEVSSTLIRNMIIQGMPITGLVPPEIEEDILRVYRSILIKKN